jgi:hypothetical protein
MIRPAAFAFDPETASSNAFQRETRDDAGATHTRAVAEFDAAVETLRGKGVGVFVFEDTVDPAKPDAVFPNNWVTFHQDGTVIVYPMFAATRRAERRRDIIDGLRAVFDIGEIVDLSENETRGRFLEGTGSMVLDRVNGVAYACLSPRTDEGLFREVCGRLSYEPVVFRAHGRDGREIYHTNVMMCVADDFATVCLDSISDEKERLAVAARLRGTGHELIDITFEQMEEFAGNMLALRSDDGGGLVALSRRAFDALSGKQRSIIERHCELVPLAVPTIECAGGGSVRCMMAEIFVRRRA